MFILGLLACCTRAILAVIDATISPKVALIGAILLLISVLLGLLLTIDVLLLCY